MRLLKIFMALCALSMTGCAVYPDAFRSAKNEETKCLIENTSQCPSAVVFLSESENKSLGILEIDEQGQYIDRAKANEVINLISKSPKSNVILYVHGWNHNAAEGNANLEYFKNAIKVIQAGNNEQKTIGIYVGWRAKIYPWYFNLVTFWDRKNVSEEVGRGALRDFILQTEEKVKEKNGKFILIGHSFGASALFNAIEPILTSRFYRSKKEKELKKDEALESVGDMVILVNPAIETMRFAQFRESVWRAGVNNSDIFSNNFKPVFISIGAADDTATQIAFPLGRFFSTLSENHRDLAIIENNSGGLTTVNEANMDRTAIGNYAPFYTHWLNLIKDYDYEKEPPLSEYCTSNKEWLYESINKKPISNDWDTGTEKGLVFRLATTMVPSTRWSSKDLENMNVKNRTWRTNPYWFVRANSNMIYGHNGFWSTGSACFVLNLLTAEKQPNK